MRDTDEQLEQVVARSRRLRARAATRRAVTLDALATAACLVLIAFVASTIPQLDGAASEVTATKFGSLVLIGPAQGYVIISVLAFLMGVFVALLCVHLRGGRGR